MRSVYPVTRFATFVTLAAVAACAASAPAPRTAVGPAEPPSPEASPSLPAEPNSLLVPPAASSSSPAPPAAKVEPDADAGPAGPVASPATSMTTPASTSACNEQSPQDFLIRGNFLKLPKGNDRAIQYRTEQYGYFKGFGRAAPGSEPPSAQLVSITFMGIPIKMHRKVAPALACVEKEIAVACANHPYTPHALAGIRYRNTYRGGEVTNHAYGIAIDIDPDVNTCCGCVPPWNDAPACKRKGISEYDHMAMPECWVHAFERYGFYWLGHDVLRDTMHFEFLGDPDRIAK
jgi:hypothetical protein